MPTKTHIKHRHKFWRFVAVLLAVLAYLTYMIVHYGIALGIGVTLLTWAFFIFATPVADGGLLIAFPVRLLLGIRMLVTQYFVWAIGAAVVIGYMIFSPATFDKAAITQLFYIILTTPWPLWIILALSAAGTYINLVFDDEIVDVAAAKNKKAKLISRRKKMYINIILFAATIAAYIGLLKITGIQIAFL